MANPYNLEFDTRNPWEDEGPLPRVQIKVPGFVWDCLEIGYRDGRLLPSPDKTRRLRQIINVGLYLTAGDTFIYNNIQIPGTPPFGVTFRKAVGAPGDVATRENLVMIFSNYGTSTDLYDNDAIARATAFLNALRPLIADCNYEKNKPILQVAREKNLTPDIAKKLGAFVRYGERERPEGPRVARPPRTLPPRRRAGDPEPAPGPAGPAEPPPRDPGGGTGPAAAGAPQGGRRRRTRKSRSKSKKTLRRR